MLEIKCNSVKLIGFLIVTIALILFCNVLFFWLETIGVGSFRFNSLFYVNEESNIPTYFSSLNLLLASGISYAISLGRGSALKTTPAFWRLLSIIFLFLSFDEAAMFHERIYRVTVLFTEYFDTPLVWYIPYSLLAIVAIACLWKNFIRLALKVQLYFATSALIFLMGAIGMEHISNNCGSILGINCNQWLLFALTTLEETLEMVGICVFNYASLKILTEQFDYISIQLKIPPK